MQELSIHCLGGFRAGIDGEVVRAYHSSKVPALLCYLAMTAHPHSRPALAGLLWRDLPEANARANLRKALSNLRRFFKPYLVITRYEVGINQEAPIWLDVAAFEAGLAPGGSKTQLREALALYQGDFLGGFEVNGAPAFEAWSLAQRARLREMALQAFNTMIARLEREGEFRTAIDYAKKMLAIEPWREEGHRQLIKLLAQTGQRGAALKQYETCRKILQNEFGVPPSAETQALYAVVRGDEGNPLVSSQSAAVSMRIPREAAESPTNLPPEPTPFIGRGREKRAIADHLGDPTCWLLTISGPGGIGKTRLALSAAAELLPKFPGGVYWVALDPLREENLILPAIARTFDVRDVEKDRLFHQVVLALDARGEVLLLLDNFEHLLDAAPLLSDLHVALPRTTFLVTSRESLRLYGERIFPVPPLQVPVSFDKAGGDQPGLENESIALFVQQAAAAAPGFRLTKENAAAIGEICRWLQGHPLAIELAAARIPLLSPQAMLERFAERDALDWLRTRTRDRPLRHHSLRATLDWSYQLLDPQEQALFQQLAVFAGGFTLPAAAAIWRLDQDPLEALSALVDKSLLFKTGEVAGEPRFDMLRPIHDYAWERLELSGSMAATANRHLAYYVGLVEGAAPMLKGPRKRDWLARLEAERDNIRQALDWSMRLEMAEPALRLAAALLWYWYVRGPAHEGYLWLTRTLDLAKKTDAPGRLRALVAAGILADRLGDEEAARKLLTEGAAISRERGDHLHLAYALSALSTMEWDRERRADLESESEALFQEVGDRWGLAHLYYRHGHDYLWHLRDVPAAQRRLEASVALFQAVGDRWQLHEPLTMLGDVAAAKGDYLEADEIYRQALALCHEVEDDAGLGWALTSLARSAMAQMAYGQAAELWAQSASIYERCGWRRGICFTCLDRGTLARLEGNFRRAENLLKKSHELAGNIGLERSLSYIAQELGYALLYGRRFRAAVAYFAEALAQGIENQPLHAALAVPGVAAVAAGLEQPERAAALFDAAKLLGRTTIQNLGFAFNHQDYARHLAFARERLEAIGSPRTPGEWESSTAAAALAFASHEAAALSQEDGRNEKLS